MGAPSQLLEPFEWQVGALVEKSHSVPAAARAMLRCAPLRRLWPCGLAALHCTPLPPHAMLCCAVLQGGACGGGLRCVRPPPAHRPRLCRACCSGGACRAGWSSHRREAGNSWRRSGPSRDPGSGTLHTDPGVVAADAAPRVHDRSWFDPGRMTQRTAHGDGALALGHVPVGKGFVGGRMLQRV